MSSKKKFEVGQQVVVTRNGRLSPTRGKVRAVGRTLVQVEVEGVPGRWKPYRIETGVANDTYGHSRIYTLEEYDQACLRREVVQRLAARGLRFDYGAQLSRVSTETLNKIADLIEKDFDS